MKIKLKRLATLITAFVMAITLFPAVGAYAKATPRLSVSEYDTMYMSEEKNYTIRLTGAGKSKVKWTVMKDPGFDSPILRVVSKSKKKIVLSPLRNGCGYMVCKVGKTRLEVRYSVYLKEATEAADAGLTDDELYQKAVNREIPVLGKLYYDYKIDSFYRTDKWDYLPDQVHITEHVDFDNDGVDEVIVDSMDVSDYLYGGIYLDTQDGKVYELSYGDGMSDIIGYTTYKDAIWIVHSDTTHAGRQYWSYDRYEGYGDPVETITLSWDKTDYYSNDEYDEDDEYYYNGEEISMDEFFDHVKELGLEDDIRETE